MINSGLAQSIVDKMMGIIPYNVNIMDSKGYIIGSGDKSRINSLHKGAVEALEFKSPIEIYSKEEGVKEGVNLPISFNNRIVGVIGITGNPESVRAFGELVKVTAELLLNQEYSIQKHIMKNKLKEEFIFEWVHKKEIYNLDFINRGKELGINLEIERYCLMVLYEKEKANILKSHIDKFLVEDEYYINIDSDKLLLILNEKLGKVHNRIKNFKNMDLGIRKITIEKVEKILAKSFYSNLKAITIADKINFSKDILEKNDIKFLKSLEGNLDFDEGERIIELLKDHSTELLESFLAFIENNYEVSKTAKIIHVHRNTLFYRINKIEEITELSFNNYLGKYRLTEAYICNKIKESKK
ncbi:MAG: CdaR family transcriptional regulator [Sarcina sp.]